MHTDVRVQRVKHNMWKQNKLTFWKFTKLVITEVHVSQCYRENNLDVMLFLIPQQNINTDQ